MDSCPSVAWTVRMPLLLCLLAGLHAAAAISQQILDQQPLSPIDIKQYTVEPSTAPSGESAYLHKIVIQNEMEEPVTAAQLLFVGNDGFAIQSLHRATLPLQVRAEQRGSGAWTTPQNAGQFAVLVEKVRYANGEIWSADHEDLATALRTIDPEFPATRLRDEPQQAVIIKVKIEID